MNRIACRLLIFIAHFAFVFTNVEAVNEGKVGTPKGSFDVSGTGAATYQLVFDAPYGGKLMPKMGIAYNSQSGGGIVGYGCDITGISVITRGGKNLFYDKKTGGVTYKADDAYYLDGTRLMLQSGGAGTDGAVYSPEGNPYYQGCRSRKLWDYGLLV